MKRILVLVAIVAAAALLAVAAPRAGAEGIPPIGIVHTPPSGTLPGHQIYLSAVITNATAAIVSWRNDTMTSDGLVPMTNLTRANGSGWVFAAYLPAQPGPTQITYAINASNAGGFHIESYFLSVDVPSTPGLTAADQESWVWTIAASLAMIVSIVAVLYWYTGRRLAREVG